MLKNQKLYPTALLYVLAVLCFLPVNANAQIPGALVEREDAAHGHPQHDEHVADTGMNQDPLAELALLSESNKELLGQIKQLEAQLSSMERQLSKATAQIAASREATTRPAGGKAYANLTQCLRNEKTTMVATPIPGRYGNMLKAERDHAVNFVLKVCGVH